MGFALFACVGFGRVASAAPNPTATQDESKQGDGKGAEVRDARVEGNLAYTEQQILDYLEIKIGKNYDSQAVRAGMKFLWQRIRVRVEEIRVEQLLPGNPASPVRIYVRVTETASANLIEVRGNLQFTQRELLDSINVPAGGNLDQLEANRIAGEVRRFYHDRGYVFADVRWRIDPENHKAIYDVMEGPVVKIANIEFTGNVKFPAHTFLGLGQHLSSSMDLHGKFLFFHGSEYSEKKLRQDLVALRKFYRNEGYRDAVVECLPPRFSEDGTSVDLTILIGEGPLYRVASVDVTGVRSFSKQEILDKVKLKPGDPYTFDAVLRDYRAIQRFYGENGFPKHISLSDSWDFKLPPGEGFHEDENEALVDITYEVGENSPKRIRDIRISGNTITQDRIIRRELTFNPGEQVNQPEIERSMQRLEALNYFDTAGGILNYRFVDTPDPAWKDIEVSVAEGKTGSVLFAGGISSNDGPFVSITFQKRNFNIENTPTSIGNAIPEVADGTAFTGAGQDLSLSIAPGLQLSQFDLRFAEPDLFGDHIKRWYFSGDLYFRVRRLPTHREDRFGEQLTLGKSLTENLSIDATIRNENINLTQIDADAPAILFDQRGNHDLRSLRFGISYHDTDLPIEPTRGFSARLEQESSGGPLAGQFDFEKTNLVVRHWEPLGLNAEGHSHTLLFQGRVGVAFPYGGDQGVPYSERFFLGGEGSLRGFQYRGVGPVALGKPLGGEAYYVGTVEYRFPLFATRLPGRDEDVEVFRGVVFTDWGAEGLDTHDDNLLKIRSSVGVGIRVRIPFLPQLPIAIHLGVPWLRYRTDDLRVLSFTIGQF
ncbi:MAG: BamA/TamA family outer membrane protein [Planctomycetes bacterium]|nr:BamA/TamA family outer membrane protein [Planctomycetota bacterium]